jgi:hypothetical protein
MKTKNNTLKSLSLTLTVAMFSGTVLAKNDNNNGNGNGNGNDDKEAIVLVAPKHLNGNNGSNKGNLTINAKAGELKTVAFNGVVKVPEQIRVNAAILRTGNSQVQLTFDNRVVCTYQTKLTIKFFNAYYGLANCNNGARANDAIDVNSSVSLLLKDVKGTPATVYAALKIEEKYLAGLKFPDLDVSEGQILRYDGELWVPTDYIPDGQANGDVLVWDGSAWTASKINAGGSGAKGEKGDTGDQGPVGPQGPQGLTGATGATGSVGATGAVGPQGQTGATGAMGPQGPQGPAGIAGLVGLTGATGPQGPQGAQGPAGVAGLNGINGVNGAKGDKGDKGDQGLKGDKGDKGEQGDAGLVSLTAGNGILGGTIQGNGGTIAVNTGTGAGQIPVVGSDGKLHAAIMPYAQQKIAFIKDVKPSGTHGGACDPANGWNQVRDLNSVSGDQSFIALSSNQITLDAGTYAIEASAPAYLDGFHKAILVNAETNASVLLGSNSRSHGSAGGMEPSVIMGQLVLSAQSTFVIKHRCSSKMDLMGFGSAVSFGVDEVYTQVKITKLK